MCDQQVGESAPVPFREEHHQIEFDGFRVAVSRERQALSETHHMGVHNNAFIDVKCISKQDICCLSGDAAQLNKTVHRGGQGAAECALHFQHRLMDCARLVPPKVECLDEWFDGLRRTCCKCLNGWECTKECRCRLVDADIGGLR